MLKTQCREALNLIRVVAHLKWGGNRDTPLMLYQAIVRSKLDYGCIVYGTTSNTNLRQLDSIRNSGLRLALRAFCTSPISSVYTEANETPLEWCWLKLSMHYYLKTCACSDNPAHALHEFAWTIRDLYAHHVMKFTLMAPKWTLTAISRMVRQPAANCPKDCQTAAPSWQLRLQPSLWHWTITDTWAQFITM